MKKIRLVLKREWNGFSLGDGPKAKRIKIPAGTHEVERKKMPCISGKNAIEGMASTQTVLLSQKRSEPWFILKGTDTGAPEWFWRGFQNGQPNWPEDISGSREGLESIDGSDEELTSWGDYAVEIIMEETPDEPSAE